MTHPTPKPEALRLADDLERASDVIDSGRPPVNDFRRRAAACLRRLYPFEAECDRLQAICAAVHDRLLRGDDDRELLTMLEAAWKK